MRRRHLFLKGLLIAVVLIVGFYVARWSFFNVFHQDDVLDGMIEFRTQVMRSMENGNESDVFYVKNIEVDDITMINRYVDSAFGDVDSFRVLVSSGDYLAVQLSYNQSENYYVIRKVLYGEEIPADKTRATAIYDAYQTMYDACIKEPMSDYEKELAVHDYLVKHCSYGFPENESDAYDAYGVLVLETAVCDGYAEAFFVCMTCLGIDCDIVVGTSDDELHAWNQVQLDGDWYNVDMTWDDALPDTGEYVKHVYLNVNDEALAENHEWETTFYHACTQESYNYYVKNIYTFDTFSEFQAGIERQLGRSNVLEAAVCDLDTNQLDLAFLYDNAGVTKVQYLVERMGGYSVIVVYINM